MMPFMEQDDHSPNLLQTQVKLNLSFSLAILLGNYYCDENTNTITKTWKIKRGGDETMAYNWQTLGVHYIEKDRHTYCKQGFRILR